MTRLSKKLQDSIKALLLKNTSIRKISTILKIPKSTIHDYATTIEIKTHNSAGRKKILSPQNITYAVTQLTTNKTKSIKNLTQNLQEHNGIKVSRQTLSRELHNAGLRSTTKKKKPAISQKNRKERLAFAKSHKDWTVDDWKRVVFSDETKINRFGSDGKSWTWIREGERSLQPRNVKATIKGGGGSLMVWGCITAGGVGYLADIEGIMDQNLYLDILKTDLRKTIDWYGIDEEKMIFMQDNDPKHTAKKVKNYLSEQEFKLLSWPAQSPDLNPIENCWSYLKAQLYAYDKQANGLKELWERLEVEWEKIKVDYIEKLYESMPRRMSLCIKAKGYWTKY